MGVGGWVCMRAQAGELVHEVPLSAHPPAAAKESACGCAGMFSAPVALALYAAAFEAAGALPHLEAFASHNGPDFYGLPRNEGEE